MTTMQCTQLAETLAQRPEEPLSAPAVSHLSSCPDCGSLWTELEAIRNVSRELGADEAEPPEHLWFQLRDQLRSEGLIRDEKQPSSFSTRFANWFGFSPRFAMGGAYMALLAIAAGSLITFQTGQPTAMRLDAVRPSLSSLSSTNGGSLGNDLNKTLDGDLDRVVASLSKENAPLASSLRQNLGVVDNLIVLCERSVRDNPGNPIAREYLYGAYQQKATLLAAAMERSTLENR